MRAVNLLPEKHRPRKATGAKSGSSYVLLGVLGAVVAGVLMYVLTLNSINSAKTDIAEAKAATEQANAQTQQLGAYGDFAKVKQQRVDTVKGLATERMDWERVVRELAHVLPSGVWIQTVNATDATAGAVAAAPASGGSESTSTDPTLTVAGCAPDQSVVADTLVRLRQLQGAVDVKLNRSATQEEAGAGGTSAPAGVVTNCGMTDGKANYDFQVDVSFERPTGATGEATRVPARLGGGQ
jgi:Tfp pilus assembly protein PilN